MSTVTPRSPQAEAAKPIDATAANAAVPASVVLPPASPDDAEAEALRGVTLGLGWTIEHESQFEPAAGVMVWHIIATRCGRSAWSMHSSRAAAWREVMAGVADAEGRIAAARAKRLALNAVKRARRAVV